MNKKVLILVVVIAAVAFSVVRIAGLRRSGPHTGSSTDGGRETPGRAVVEQGTPGNSTGGLGHAESAVVNEAAVHQARLLQEIAALRPSDTVKAIIDLDGKNTDYAARQTAIRALYNIQLTEADLKALMLFLDFRSADNSHMPVRSFNAVKNDVLDFMLRQARLPAGLGAKLSAMAGDSQHDDVWRDYCVQYMQPCYEKLRQGGDKGGEAPELGDIRTNLWKALSAKDKTLAGTALLGVDRLSRKYPEIDRKEVEQAAQDLVRDDRACEASRITALRICGQNGLGGALPMARILAQTGDTTVLRMAAVATVGDLGDSTDVELLTSLAGNSEKGIADTAASAIKRLKAR